MTDEDREALTAAVCSPRVKAGGSAALYADADGTLPTFAPDDPEVAPIVEAVLAAGFRRPDEDATRRRLARHLYEADQGRDACFERGPEESRAETWFEWSERVAAHLVEVSRG